MSNFNATPLREGEYTGEVISQKLTESSTGTKLFELSFGNLTFQDGTDTGQAIAGDTHRIVRLPLTDRAAKFTIRKLTSLGFEGSPSQFTPEAEDHISVIGTVGKLRMKHSDWGEDWDVNLGNGSKPLDLMTAKQEDAKWSHLMPKAAPKPPAAGATTPAATLDGNSWK